MVNLTSLQDQLLRPSIPIGFLGDFLQAAQYRGLDVESLLREHELSITSLDATGLRLSVEKYSGVLKQLQTLTDDAFLGFLSRPVPIDAFRVFCYSIVGCRNLPEFIQQANEFYALFTDEFSWSLTEEGSDLLLGIDIKPVLPVDYRFVAQSLLLMTIRLFGWLLGEDVESKSVSFTFAKNTTDDNLAYLFGQQISYDADTNHIRIDAQYQTAPLSCSRDQITLMLQNTRHLFWISRLKNPFSQEVRRLLLVNKSEEWLDVEAIAGLLNLTENQLWRKLKKENTSFSDIRDQIKRDWALVLLEDPTNTVERVAEILRYSDVSAFRKAFKNWTGLQPANYRDRLGNSQ